MSFRIQHNIAALNAERNLAVSDSNMSKSLERLSSGYRINSAKDDAAGLAISQGFRANIASVQVAQRNLSEANSLLQTAEGGMAVIGDILTRMKELATQSASGNVGTSDRTKLSNEYASLYSEIDRIVNTTKYSGTKLIDGNYTSGNSTTDWNGVANVYDVTASTASTGAYTVAYTSTGTALAITKNGVTETKSLSAGAQTVNFSTLGISFKTTGAFVANTGGAALAAAAMSVDAGAQASFQIGYNNTANDRLGITLSNSTTTALGLTATDIASASSAQTALTTIDTAVGSVATYRGNIGAYQNRLTYAASNLSVTLENFTASESVIRDVDMASEMTQFTKNQILVQAGTSMLAQANMASQNVLSLFK